MKKIFSYILTALLTIQILYSSEPVKSYGADNLDSQITQTVESLKHSTGADTTELLSNETLMPAGTSLCDWIALVLALSNETDDYDAYLQRLETYVTEQYAQNGSLSDTKATEYHRIALTVSALGGNPEQFGTDANGNPINLVKEGTYDFESDLSLQGVNGLAYALLVLNSNDYEIPENAKHTEDEILCQLLETQTKDGSFSLSGNTDIAGDADITAMVLQALAPYQNQENTSLAIEKSLTFLSKQMTSEGRFTAFGAENSEASAQVILALCALGIDPEKDARFQKNGVTVLDGLNSYRTETGGYKHLPSDSEANVMATQQALLALEALQKFHTDGSWILDFTAYMGPEKNTSHMKLIIVIVMVGISLTIPILILFSNNKRKRSQKETLW